MQHAIHPFHDVFVLKRSIGANTSPVRVALEVTTRKEIPRGLAGYTVLFTLKSWRVPVALRTSTEKARLGRLVYLSPAVREDDQRQYNSAPVNRNSGRGETPSLKYSFARPSIRDNTLRIGSLKPPNNTCAIGSRTPKPALHIAVHSHAPGLGE